MSARVIFEDELVQLWQGDYRDELDMLARLGADAVITDPPYGETTLSWDRWVEGWTHDAARVSDVLWCFGSFRMFWDHRSEWDSWKLAQDVVWEKHNGSSLAADRFRRVHELATMFYRGEWGTLRHEVPTTTDATPRTVRRKAKPTHHQGARGASRYVSEDGGPRMMRSVIRVRSEHGRAVHPTQKPLGIVTPLVEYSVPPGGLVVDLFGGSFTTALAARMLGRRAVAFEGDATYAAAGARRFEQLEFVLGAGS